MTVRDERLERLQAACDLVNAQTVEDLTEQALKVSGNLFLMLGGELCLSPEGFVMAMQKSHEATLMWLLAEGYVTLTDKSTITADERRERDAKKESAVAGPGNVTAIRPDVGAYL